VGDHHQLGAGADGLGHRGQRLPALTQADLSEVDLDAEAAVEQVEREQRARVFEGGGDDPVAGLPGQAPGADVHPVGRVVRDRDLLRLGADEGGEPRPQLDQAIEEPHEAVVTYPALSCLPFRGFGLGVDGRLGKRAGGAGVEVGEPLGHGQAGADGVDVELGDHCFRSQR